VTLPSLSLANAETVMFAPTAKLAPAAGALIDTCGGWFGSTPPQTPRS
jgi:hypothetical protein